MSNVRLWTAEWDRTFVIDGRQIDPAARRIRTVGAETEVEPRVMALLIALAQKQGEIVRRQDLIDLVWRGAPGADASLSNAVSLLRRALGDTSADRHLIVTVPKQGYRLTVPLERDVLPLSEKHTTGDSSFDGRATDSRQAQNVRNFYRWLLVAVSLTVVIIASYLFLDRDRRVIADKPNNIIANIEPRSIAVLPFVNMSSDAANDYFSDGLAEEVLNALAQIDSLKVASRTDSFQFRGTDTSIEEISKRLKVATVLEGSVREDGGQLRVTVQLISASDGRHLWSSTYDGNKDDVFSIQKDIALNIADALIEKLSDDERELVTALPTDNLRAYEFYLIGNYQLQQWSIDGNRRAIDSFKQAVALDPKFEEAHLALGGAYYFAGTHYGWMSPKEAIPKVKASLVHGIASKKPQTRAAALSIYGDVLAWGDKDWQGALAAFQRAYELSGKPMAGYALTNSIIGNHDAAIGIIRKQIEGGEDDNGTRNNLAWAYFNARRYEESLETANAIVKADSGFADAYRVIGRAQLMLGENGDAIEAFAKADQLLNGAPVARSDLAVALAKSDRKTEARTILEELIAKVDYVPAPLIAQIYANMGEKDEAFKWLKKGIEDGARGVIFLKINPLYDPLRNDPRFSKLLVRLNLEV